VTGLALWLLAGWLFGDATGVLALAALLAVSGVVGGLVYLVLLEALGVRDMRQVLAIVRARVGGA